MLASPEVYKTLDKLRFQRPKPLTFTPPRAFGARITVRPLEADTQAKSTGGIRLMESTIKAMEMFNTIGIIESVGNSIPTDSSGTPCLQAGQYVVLPRYLGDEIVVKQTRFLSVFAEGVVMIIDNPDELINFSDDYIYEGSVRFVNSSPGTIGGYKIEENK